MITNFFTKKIKIKHISDILKIIFFILLITLISFLLENNPKLNLHVYIVLSLLIVVALYFFLFFALFLQSYQYDISRGKYQRALLKCKNLLEKKKRKPKYEFDILFHMSILNYRLGEFKKSIQTLDKIKKIDMNRKQKCFFHHIYAGNLIFLKKENHLIEEHIDKALSQCKFIEYYPLTAFFYLKKNYNEYAMELVKEYQNHNKKEIIVFEKYFISHHDQFQIKYENNFYLGSIFYLLDEFQKAKEHLILTAQCKFDNYFTQKSKELLEQINSNMMKKEKNK